MFKTEPLNALPASSLSYEGLSSEDYKEDFLQPSNDSYQPGFSKSSHHPSISTFTANPIVKFTFQGNHNLQIWEVL
jgi:hypothetical protein